MWSLATKKLILRVLGDPHFQDLWSPGSLGIYGALERDYDVLQYTYQLELSWYHVTIYRTPGLPVYLGHKFTLDRPGTPELASCLISDNHDDNDDDDVDEMIVLICCYLILSP